MSELQNTVDWFKQAIPEPTQDHAIIQIGCHIEEVAEMFESFGANELASKLHGTANQFKEREMPARYVTRATNKNALLDSLVDQIVTAVGVGHMMGFDMLGALAEVNRSNYSKFEDGKAVFNENGKITKGKNYTAPNLSGMV